MQYVCPACATESDLSTCPKCGAQCRFLSTGFKAGSDLHRVKARQLRVRTTLRAVRALIVSYGFILAALLFCLPGMVILAGVIFWRTDLSFPQRQSVEIAYGISFGLLLLTWIWCGFALIRSLMAYAWLAVCSLVAILVAHFMWPAIFSGLLTHLTR